MWVPLGDFNLGVSFENHTSHPPSEISSFIQEATPRQRSSSHMDLLFRKQDGQLSGNHFLPSPKGKRTFEHWRECLWQGAQDVIFKLK